SSPTDVAISGGGFFVVNQKSDQTGQVLFTRAGSFTQDAQGNFRNTAGLFLQAWPLDRNGNLPGAPGNLNTNSSANISSLQTVNVRNLTGTASPTTTVGIGANLKSSQVAFNGAGGVAAMDAFDSNNKPLKGSDIIIPTTINSIVRGDSFNVTTGAGLSYIYNYGGFTFGRSVLNAANGDSGVALIANNTTLNNTPIAIGAGGISPTSNAVGASVVTITVASTANLRSGDYITIAGETATVDGITPAQLNGTRQITVLSPTTFSVVSSGTATLGNGTVTGGGGAGVTATPQIFRSNATTKFVDVTQIGHGLVDGAVIRLSGITANLGNIPFNELNDSFVVDVTDADHYRITLPTTTALASTSGGTGTVLSTTRPFASTGNILDAVNASQPFLGTTGTAGFTNAGLTFSVTTAASGSVTFTYTPTAPNAALGQFNNLNNLADAINNTSGLTARVVNGRIYIGARDANAAVSFANGSTVGTSGPPVKAGIDWIRELGLAPVASGLNRFNSLESLGNLVNLSAGLDATLSNPLGASSLAINVTDPLDTITFTDNGTNTGSLLGQLGLAASLNSAVFTARTTGALGPAYDPANPLKNMASGSIPPQFSRPVTVYDALGTAHNLNVGFLKTSTNTWAVEVYAQPATDVNTALPNGQLASGTLTFNGDGSLRSVSSALSTALNINWTNGSAATSITYDWGTAGQPFGTLNAASIGKTDGMSQFDSGYNVSFVNQNGAPVGQLTGISIDANGFITASYSNGETSSLYKIPLASFTDPNSLTSNSGNAYAQSNGSGGVNLKEAGTSGVGTFAAGSLELSNVELASQLTDMIVAQRAYQANTKVIQTADTLLTSLDQLIR
ncbi:MAG: flagellar hook-basal body complex protein, partial [Rickettsiales bacterium]|nr:flagellar hook-basal body complex protein [Rickettsiales bacterium]